MRKSKTGEPKQLDLLQLFSIAVQNVMSLQNAKATVNQEEALLLQAMQYAGGEDQFTSTEDLSQTDMSRLAQESMNVHLSKVQSRQFEQYIYQQLDDLQKQADKFAGKKVVIEKISNNSDVFVALYYEPNHDEYRRSNYTANKLKGKIKEVRLDENSIYIEPTFLAKKLTPNRDFIQVNVIDFHSTQPQIKMVVN